jgi:hypothetical protein
MMNMATWFFHEETLGPDDRGTMTIVRYYFDDIAGEALTRSFHFHTPEARTEFIDNERIAFADLRTDVKTRLIEYMARRKRSESDLRLAS